MDKSLQVMVMYLLTHIGLIFFMYPTDIIGSLTVGHWSAILLGFACHVTIIGVYMKGLSYVAPKGLIDIFLTMGKVMAVILLFPVAVYFLMVLILTVRAYSEIITIIFLPIMPLWTIMALLLIVATLITVLGIEALFRTGVLVGVLFLPLLLLVIFLSFQNVDWRYAFPMLDQQAASFSYVVSRPYLLSMFAFTGGFLFLGFIPPYIPYKRHKIMWASPLLLPLFLISTYIPLLTFGQSTASKFHFPFITAIDTVNVTWLMFDRITVFFMISLICFVLLFLSLVLWKVTQLIRRGFPIIQPLTAKLFLALVIFIVCLQIPDWNTVEQLFWWNTYLRLYVMTVIPVATLVLGLRHDRKGVACP